MTKTKIKERWKPIPLHPEYEVSDHGRVRKLQWPRHYVMTTHLVSGGLSVVLRNNGDPTTKRVSRLVGKAFCRDYSDDLYPFYWNGYRTDCHYSNLLWVPRSALKRQSRP